MSDWANEETNEPLLARNCDDRAHVIYEYTPLVGVVRPIDLAGGARRSASDGFGGNGHSLV